MVTTRTPNKRAQQPRQRTRATQTAVYLTEALANRLTRYLAAKYPDRVNVRNAVIVNALHEKLTREGF